MPVNSAPDAPSVRWLPYYRVSTDRQGQSGLGLRGVLEPMARDGLSYRAMAAELAGVGKLSSTGRPLAQAQIGRILQRLGLSGKFLGSDQAWVAA